MSAEAASPAESLVLLVLKDQNDELRFLVSPVLREVVHPDDWQYFDSLLKDFVERSKHRPAALFRQLCSLGVGPLVTYKTGTALAEHPQLLELSSGFVELPK